MTGILERYAKNSTCRAESIDDVFAIALAKRLADIGSLAAYRELASRYPHAVLADAAARLMRRTSENETVSSFRKELTEHAFGGSGQPAWLIAAKVERKALAAVLLSGSRVVRVEIRKLAYSDDRAVRAAAGLIGRMCEDRPEALLAFDVTAGAETRRGRILQAAMDAARSLGRPINEVSLADMLGAGSIPPASTREETRVITRRIFAHLSGLESDELVDGLTTGLVAYCSAVFNAAEMQQPE